MSLVCGIFAFTGLAAPDVDLLTSVAGKAAQRGPHSHGWAGHGLAAHRRLGPLDTRSLTGITGTRLIGHARLATVGAHDDLAGIQPIAADGHLLVHNGTVTNWRDLVPHAHTDTGALAELYAAARRAALSPAGALRYVLVRAEQKAWAIVVLDADGTLLAHRHGLPLWSYTHSTGTYLASGSIPGATAIRADEIYSKEPACALLTPTALTASRPNRSVNSTATSTASPSNVSNTRSTRSTERWSCSPVARTRPRS